MQNFPSFVFSSTTELLKIGPESISLIGDEVPLPKFQINTVLGFLNTVIEELSKLKTTVRRINGPTLICGDLHGNVHDLFRILSQSKFENGENYVFLGDYVDRGEYSLEVVLYLFSYYMCFPNRIILLRGDHEFRSLNAEYGLKKKFFELYGTDIIWEKINDAFDLLPFFAIVNDKYLCAHGGIPPNLKTIGTLESMKLPIKSLKENTIISDIVWSDPSDLALFNGSTTDRGIGKYFSEKKLQKFLKENNLKALIRGHQKVDGVQQKWNGTLFTVHSHSIPNQRVPLRPGYIKITGLEITIGVFDIFIPPYRRNCYFYTAYQRDDSERKINWKPISLKTNILRSKATTKMAPFGIRKSTSTKLPQMHRFPIPLVNPV